MGGLLLIRQKPGSATGVMFITLEDEGGVANLVVWLTLFERRRGVVLSAGLLSCRGRVQRQGRVVHVVAEALDDLTPWLRWIGELDLGRLATGRGDETRHGGSPGLRGRPPDRAGADEAASLLGAKPRDIFIPDLHIDAVATSDGSDAGPTIRVLARDFR